MMAEGIIFTLENFRMKLDQPIPINTSLQWRTL